jgi:hypothetical protein
LDKGERFLHAKYQEYIMGGGEHFQNFIEKYSEEDRGSRK